MQYLVLLVVVVCSEFFWFSSQGRLLARLQALLMVLLLATTDSTTGSTAGSATVC